jgi:UMF1 family MFS transporter
MPNSYLLFVFSPCPWVKLAYVAQGHESAFFSLFSLTDKSASFLGPAVVGLIADKSGNIRLGFLFLLVLLLAPIPVLLKVRPAAGQEEARIWSERRRISI